MARFADPHRCPDCGSPIVSGQPACTSCELPLSGEVAQRLYRTLLTADDLLVELRTSMRHPVTGSAQILGTASAPHPVTASPVVGTSTGPLRRRGMSAASVPKILLGLGAACVLIAALVFLAVTWSVMGVGGRTATLVGLTLVCGLLAAWLARRGLRGGAEALALVALGLLSLDVVGARDAGWFGDLGDGTFLVLIGLVLVLAGAGAAVAVRRTPVRALTGAEVVAGLGTAAMAIGVATLPGINGAAGLVAAVILAAAVVVASVRLDLVWTSVTAAVVAGFAWLALLANALDRASAHPDIGTLWLDLNGWPFLAAAALVAALTLVDPLPVAARVGAAAATYAVLVLALSVPVSDEGSTAVVGVAAGALAVTAALCWWAPTRWRPAGLLVQVFAGLVVVGYGLGLGVRSAERLGEAASAGWAGGLTGRLAPFPPGTDLPEPWLLPLMVLAVLVTLVAVGRLVPGPLAAQVRLPQEPAAAARWVVPVLAATVVVTLSLLPVPVLTVVAVAGATAAGLVWWWLRTASLLTLVAAGVFLAGAVAVSGYDDVLMAVTLVLAMVLAGLVHLRAVQPQTSAVAGSVLATALAGDVWTWSHLAGAADPWAALFTLVVLALAILPVHLLPERTWSLPDLSVARAGLEVGAAIAALPTALAGVLGASVQTDLTWTAVYLTVAGVSVTSLALLRPDRHLLLPVGGLLLAAASWVRLWEVGVREPEPYTLPSAAALALVGLVHLRRNPDGSTASALSPALGLALVPSLLWALTEDPGLRALLLGSACLALVVAGTRLHWTAPMTWGAAVGALLVARLAAPYVGDAVPRWVLIGGAGAVLIIMGVTWERRLQEARQLVGYVRGLR